MRLTSQIFLALLQFALRAAAANGFSIEPAIDSIRAIQKEFIACDGDCPAYVGLLTLYFEKPTTEQDALEFEQCLSTLIAPDQLMTSEHCIPPLAMQKYIRVLFPKAGSFAAETAKVKEVVYKADILKTPLLDYAIIKLDHPLSRPPASVSPTILEKGDYVSIFTHSIQKDEKTGANFVKLTAEKCATSENSHEGEKTDVTIRLGDCLTNEGDSGGPILNSSGGLAGVVWGGGVSDTYGVNLICLQDGSNTISKGKCVQSIVDAAFRLVQSVTFQEISEVVRFGCHSSHPFHLLTNRLRWF